MSKTTAKGCFVLLLALMLLVTAFPTAALAAAPSGYTSISTLADGEGVYHITASGNYYLDGTITEATVFVQLSGTDTGYVTIAGDGIDSAAARNTITIECAAGTHLRLKNLFIHNEATGTSPVPGGTVASGASAIRFNGGTNWLDIAGDVLLESTTYVSSAVVAVNAGTTLNVTGADDSRFFMYKYTQGCGIGADANNANGTINIRSGNLFFKGSKTGAIIGNDTCGDTAKEAQMGPITISGGNIEITAVAQGAAIGGSRMSRGNNVAITGGSVFILNDYTGSAIGAGAQMNGVAANNGTLTLGSGASLKLIRTGNSLYEDRTTTQYLNDTLAAAALANGNGGVALRQCKIPVNGSSVTIKEGSATLYSGSVPTIFPYVGSKTSTVANWDYDNPESGYVYIYLTEQDHNITVNGAPCTCTWDSTNSAFTVISAAPALTLEDNFVAPAAGYFARAGITITPSAADLSFTVACAKACVVARQNAGGTYTVLSDTGSGSTHKYAANSASDKILVAVKGDPSGDGACDLTDVLAMVDAFMGTPFTAQQTVIADTNGDGSVDLTDVLAAVDAFMGTPFGW